MFKWYVGEMSGHCAESLLKQTNNEGSFVTRESTRTGCSMLSLCAQVQPRVVIMHFQIKRNTKGEFSINEKHYYESIPDLINHHRQSSDGLPCRLTCSPIESNINSKWEIDHSDLTILEELGAGSFGVVRRAKWRGFLDTAVKFMRPNVMSEDEFMEEAKVMTKLKHKNIVRLYGYCCKHRPILIVTEYMKHGSLLKYLIQRKQSLIGNMGVTLELCKQVCEGMTYLMNNNYVHRDLAARNCLMGPNFTVKVADFGLTRHISGKSDHYTGKNKNMFPMRSSPPEVINHAKFSSKSDVWSFGVLMYEIFTCGKCPFEELTNDAVLEHVKRGHILNKPENVSTRVYTIMKSCMAFHPENRPKFDDLQDSLNTLAKNFPQTYFN